MEAGPLALAIALATLVAVGGVTLVVAVRKALRAAPHSAASVPRRSRRRARPTLHAQRRPAALAAAPLAPAEVGFDCRQIEEPEPRLLVIVTHRGATPVTVQHAALLFWPGDDGRWSWRNLFAAVSDGVVQGTPLPTVLATNEAVRLLVPKDALLRHVREHLPPGSPGFGVRVFMANGQTADSPLLRLASLDADCPPLDPSPPPTQSRPAPG